MIKTLFLVIPLKKMVIFVLKSFVFYYSPVD